VRFPERWSGAAARKGVSPFAETADGFIGGFQHRSEAEWFPAELRERFRKFHLELYPDKTRLLEFGPSGLALATGAVAT